jgi:hypothetical protein
MTKRENNYIKSFLKASMKSSRTGDQTFIVTKLGGQANIMYSRPSTGIEDASMMFDEHEGRLSTDICSKMNDYNMG